MQIYSWYYIIKGILVGARDDMGTHNLLIIINVIIIVFEISYVLS